MATFAINVVDKRDGSILVDLASNESAQAQVMVYLLPFTPGEAGVIVSVACACPGSVVIPNIPESWIAVQAVAGFAGMPQTTSIWQLCPRKSSPHFGISLTRESIEVYTEGRTTGYRLKAQAITPINMPQKIFVYQREPFQAYGDAYRDTFIAVCKPGDFNAYPEDAPASGAGGEPPFYRLGNLDLVFDNLEDLEETWTAIYRDVQELVSVLELNDQLSRDGVYNFGAGTGA